MNTEILVVDDSAPLAQETAELIRVGAQLGTCSASDSATALRLVERHPISVAVLDQRMGADLSGTELFQRLREVRPDLRVIMLTGEAGADEVGQALALGFHDYLPKGRIAELPGLVLVQYVTSRVAELEQRTNAEDVLLWPRRRWWPWPWPRRGAEIRLTGWRIVGERFIDPDSWATVVQVNAGEEHRIASQVTRTSTLVVEQHSQQTLQANIGLKARSLGEITSALQSVLTDSARMTRTVDNSSTDSTEQTFRLPEEPETPGTVYVRARLYQRAPVRRKVLVTLSAACGCCGLATRVPVVVLQDTGLLATRHEDRMSDGTVRTVETGDIAA